MKSPKYARMVANILISHGAMHCAALGFLLQSRESKTGCDELRLGEEIAAEYIVVPSSDR